VSYKNTILNSDKVVIISHKGPDGDAVGSSLALYFYLKQLDKDSIVILPDNFPAYFSWLNESENIIIADEDFKTAETIIDKADLIFCLDFNDLSRVGKDLEELLKKSKADFFMIDHHQNPKNFAKYSLSRTESCSTAQLIYNLIEKNNDIELINKDIAEALYTGIITDSGSFQYSNVEAETHKIASLFLEKGLNHSKVHDNIFNNNKISKLHLLGYALQKIEIIDNYPVAYISLSEKEIQQFSAVKGDTEGLVNYCLSIDGVEIAAFIREHKDIIKLSIRSLGETPINTFATKHFNGGGHINAAGGMSNESLEKTVSKFKSEIKNYLS